MKRADTVRIQCFQPKTRVAIIEDIRRAQNLRTFNQAVDLVIMAGIKALMTEDEPTPFIEAEVAVAKQPRFKLSDRQPKIEVPNEPA